MIIDRFDPASKRHLAMGVAGFVFVLSALLMLFQQRWGDAIVPLILIMTVFVPLVIEKWASVRLPASVQVQYALLLFAGPYFGGWWDYYRIWLPWDTVIHFYSGFVISFAIIVALGQMLDTYRLTLPAWLEFVLVVTVKAFVALLWEIGEFSYDLIFNTRTQIDNFDTMTDMIAGLTPSLAIAAALVLYRRKGWFSYMGFSLKVSQESAR